MKDKKHYDYVLPVCENCGFCNPMRGMFRCVTIPIISEHE
jgi:hypothetical protein